MSALTRLPPTLRGILWMIASGLGFTGMAIMIRVLTPTFSTFELLFFRAVVAVALLTPWMVRTGRSALATKRFGLHALRAFLAYVGMLGLFYGIGRIPLSDAIALQFTQPLFIVLLAIPVLGETLRPSRIVAMGVGFLGVLVLLRPGFAEISLATWAVLAASLVYAGSNSCIKLLVRTEPANRTVVYVNLLMMPMALVPAVFFWTVPTLLQAGQLLLLGLTAFAGVFCLTRAFNVADASAVAPYDFLRLPFAVAAGWLLFGEATDAFTWAGAVVIFAAAYGLVRAESAAVRRGGRGGRSPSSSGT